MASQTQDQSVPRSKSADGAGVCGREEQLGSRTRTRDQRSSGAEGEARLSGTWARRPLAGAPPRARARLRVRVRRLLLEDGPDGLLDEPRSGAPRSIMDADVERVITLTLESKPEEATHWSRRRHAEAGGVGQRD